MKKDLRVEMSLIISVADVLMAFHCVFENLCNIRMLMVTVSLPGSSKIHIKGTLLC